MGKCDLHVHTVCSDGTGEPADVVAAASRAGLCAIAITDHDTVNGLPEAIEAGRRLGVEILPGIELTAEHEGSEVHMLGYLFDFADPGLNQRLAELRRNRVDRIHAMIERLAGQGVHVRPEAVFRLSREGTVGRLHLARAMVAEKVVGSVYEAFDKYIGDRCPAYVAHFKLSPAEAIALIKGYGGIPVLAHPYSFRHDELIPQFAQEGLMGLEVYYPEHSQSMINFYTELARRLGLLMTGGSDYHGSAKNVSIGEIDVPYETVQALKAARRAAG
ncbi:MAG: PHP domain-containing protein [Deltaproteobacteria bacterium]